MTSQIICMLCGYQGSLATQAVSNENSRSDRFRSLGHDFFTGEMHYQCPECKSYLKVDPMDLLKMEPASGQLDMGRLAQNPYSVSSDTDFLWGLPNAIKESVLGLTRSIGKNLGVIF